MDVATIVAQEIQQLRDEFATNMLSLRTEMEERYRQKFQKCSRSQSGHGTCMLTSEGIGIMKASCSCKDGWYGAGCEKTCAGSLDDKDELSDKSLVAPILVFSSQRHDSARWPPNVFESCSTRECYHLR